MSTARARTYSFAPVPLRLILGFGFLYHGYPKVFTSEGHQTFVGMLDGMGIAAPDVSAYLIGGFEVIGGALLIVGLAVRLIAALGAVEMLVAAVAVHAPAGFNFMNIIGTTEGGAPEFGMPGYEVNLLYIAGFAALALAGAGAVSIDAMRDTADTVETERHAEMERPVAGTPA